MSQYLQPIRDFAERYPLRALVVILLVGMLPRLWMLPISGFSLDLEQHFHWGLCGVEQGVFGVYNCWPEVTHPPISPTMLTLSMGLLQATGGDVITFDGNAAASFMLKLPNLIFEIALICLVFVIVWKRYGAAWAMLVTALLHWNLGWMIVTSWWGQNDATYTTFMLITGYLLTRKRPRWMWLAYALAWLAKFQSIMFLPVLVVFTLRRHGLRALIEGLLIYAAAFAAGVLPFLLGSGKMALNPFVGTVNLFPYITNGAFNMWFWVSGSSHLVLLDSLPFAAGLTYFQAGLIALSVGEAILCLRVWLLPERDDEFLVLAAANLSFFMLPTQIQLRYLYPGLVFLALAMVRDWRLIALYIGLSITFMYNVFDIVDLSIGLLYYPSKLMPWSPTINALAVTGLYAAFMALFLRPLWAVRHEWRQRLLPQTATGSG
ncbi:MAG: hypothetical protein CL610_23865 [Anaerolineaceae bacterium]|nr:hypothetical protein [Anaerolineaceae bacterium]